MLLIPDLRVKAQQYILFSHYFFVGKRRRHKICVILGLNVIILRGTPVYSHRLRSSSVLLIYNRLILPNKLSTPLDRLYTSIYPLLFYISPLLPCIIFALPYIPVPCYIHPLLPSTVVVLPFSPYPSTYSPYSLVSSLYSYISPYPSTYPLYSLVLSLYSNISPYPSTYPLYPLVSSLYSHISPTLLHIPSTPLYRLCTPIHPRTLLHIYTPYSLGLKGPN